MSETESARIIIAMFWIPAVPTPWRARPSRSTPQTGAEAQRMLPMVSVRTADWSDEYRPNVSERAPQEGINAVLVRVKEVTIQLSSLNLSMTES